MATLKPIQQSRELLYDLIAKNGLRNEKVYTQSCILDELILQHMERQLYDEQESA